MFKRSKICLMLFSIFFCSANLARAEWDFWGLDLSENSNNAVLYKGNSSTGTLIQESVISLPRVSHKETKTYIEKSTGDFVIVQESGGRNYETKYDVSEGVWVDLGETWYSGKDLYRRLLVLDEKGGSAVIRRTSDGSVHIGENSLVTVESGGRQKLYATDSSGDAIDIDITNGSRLLINGRNVEKSIDNVGALSAALGSVPAISSDSKFICGFGAGTHSSAYALSGGCASRVSDRVSVNAALATVINNHTGDSDDNLSARAGFTFKLGKIDDSPNVAARKAAELHDKVAKLEQRNESLIALLQAQASRLERLEQLASGQLSLMGDRASSD